ncbi:MAG: hypothetical protein ACREJO_15540 [Phycisphaerales bacterium]
MISTQISSSDHPASRRLRPRRLVGFLPELGIGGVYGTTVGITLWRPTPRRGPIPGTGCGVGTASTHKNAAERSAARQKNFVASKKWNAAEGFLLMKRKGIEIAVGQFDSVYRVGALGVWGHRHSFGSVEEAKAFLYQFIERGDLERFVEVVARKGAIVKPFAGLGV